MSRRESVDEYGSRRNRSRSQGKWSRVSITWSGTGAKDICVGGNGVAGDCIRVLHCVDEGS